MTKSKKDTKNEKLKLLKMQMKDLNKVLSQMRRHVKEERKKGPAIEEEITHQLSLAQQELEALSKKITSAKAHSKKRKREIDEWKLWYNGVAQIDKSAELKQLQEEIAWRAAEIAAKEIEISTLLGHSLVAEGKCEQLKLRLEGLSNGIWEGPIDQEPRVKNVLQEIKRIENKVAKLP
ncbi:MAG: hypothetical protein AB8G15_05775 [Saprospiraceae bacterium]